MLWSKYLTCSIKLCSHNGDRLNLIMVRRTSILLSTTGLRLHASHEAYLDGWLPCKWVTKDFGDDKNKERTWPKRNNTAQHRTAITSTNSSYRSLPKNHVVYPKNYKGIKRKCAALQASSIVYKSREKIPESYPGLWNQLLIPVLFEYGSIS